MDRPLSVTVIRAALHERRPTFRVVTLAALAVSALAAPLHAPLYAQVKVKYGEGEFGLYRRGLADFMGRASDIIDSVNAVVIAKKYCDAKERAEDVRKLSDIQKQMRALRTDYVTFKSHVNQVIATAAGLAHFTSNGANLGVGFWRNEDAEIITHPQNDLNAKLAMLDKSPLQDCTQPPKTAKAPAAPSAPPPNPLAGLTRPVIPPLPPLPAVPEPFCTEDARSAWMKANLGPTHAYNGLSIEVANYNGAIWARIERLAVGDTAARRVLEAELAWGERAHKQLDDFWRAWVAFAVNSLKVIDCTKPQTTGGPPKVVLPAVDSTKPATNPFGVDKTKPAAVIPPVDSMKAPKKAGNDGKVGFAPKFDLHFGGTAEYSYFNSFEGVAGDQPNIATFTGKTGTPGWGAGVGIGYRNWDFTLSTHSNTLEYEQTYNNDDYALPKLVTGRLRGRFHDACLGYRWRFGSVSTLISAGATYAQDKLTYDESFGGASPFSGSRTLNTWKSNVGLYVDYPIMGGLSARVGGTYTTGGKTGDADQNSRLSVGLQYRLRGDYRY